MGAPWSKEETAQEDTVNLAFHNMYNDYVSNSVLKEDYGTYHPKLMQQSRPHEQGGLNTLVELPVSVDFQPD
jgi:transposase